MTLFHAFLKHSSAAPLGWYDVLAILGAVTTASLMAAFLWLSAIVLFVV